MQQMMKMQQKFLVNKSYFVAFVDKTFKVFLGLFISPIDFKGVMRIPILSLLFVLFFGENNMVIKMPVMCGMSSHASLYSKIDKAIADKNFPIDLDCADTVFTTSMFCRFLVTVRKRVAEAGGRIRLLNVDEGMYDGLQASHMDELVEIMRKFNG